MQWPHLYAEQVELEKALADARGVMSRGVKTVVDPNAMNGSRNARFSKRVADETGIQIILATGIYTYEHLPMVFMNRDENAIADVFVHDIEQDIQGTEIKAAFLKTACDAPGMVPTSRSSIAPRRGRISAPAYRSWPTRSRQAAPASSRCDCSRRRAST
jgi:phosphotriesterase-related protein